MFSKLFYNYSWDEVQQSIYSKTAKDVLHALESKRKTLEDFKALISPAAVVYLEQMAIQSNLITQQRFGKTIQLYAPLYLSNECQNICTYCGFSFDHAIKRKTLTPKELLKEADYLKRKGFQHLLLVSGEANQTVNINYFLKAIELIKNQFSNISIEVQPLELHEYKSLHHTGVHAVLVYQETYHETAYKGYHPKGKKSNFIYRLETPDKIGMAEIHKIGLGVLLGLDDWRTDAFFCAAHLDYLEKKYWKTKFSISFPRIRPAEDSIAPVVNVSDAELVQLICAYRIFNENVELSLSTRETAHFRNAIIPLGVTSMSAGSATNPGGYTVEKESLTQFEISDKRKVADMVKVIQQQGYDAVYKDWDTVLQ